MNRPIRRRLMRMLLLTSFVVTLFTATLLAVFEVSTYRSGVVQQLEVLNSAISRNSVAAMTFENAEDAREVLAASSADPHIVDAALYDANGVLFASYRDKLRPRLAPEEMTANGYRFEGQYAIGYEPVELDGQRIGTLFVRSDLSAIGERIGSY